MTVVNETTFNDIEKLAQKGDTNIVINNTTVNNIIPTVIIKKYTIINDT